MRIGRRRFIQAGLGGSALLGLAAGCSRDAHEPTDVVRALIPVVLAGALPESSTDRETALRETAEAFHRAVAGLAPEIRAEIGELLALLAFAPTRVAVAGLWPSWSKATPAQIAGFLQRWRESRFALQRSGYRALTQLIQGAWYDNPLAWKVIGYPGPPPLAPLPAGKLP